MNLNYFILKMSGNMYPRNLTEKRKENIQEDRYIKRQKTIEDRRKLYIKK